MMTIDPMDEYKFDLNGFLILKNALSKDEVDALNQGIDKIDDIAPGEWDGHVHREEFEGSRGVAYQQIYEAGEPFEHLIDHPSWINKVEHFVGGHGTFEHKWGPLFIDECFASIRGPGEAIGLHSGGHSHIQRTRFDYHNGGFHCGQINILMALTDIGEGDGATMVVPGSHKSNMVHPNLATHGMGENASANNVEGAIEVHLKKGDAILFVDAICHGSAQRINEGDRRIMVYRYGPSWGNFRWGYEPSSELLERLNPRARNIVKPFQLLKKNKLTASCI